MASSIFSAPRSYAIFRLANKLQRRCPSVYLPLYDAYKHAHDQDQLRLIRQWVRPGMSCVEVGANVGFYTQQLARRVGPSGRVVAFEPEPWNMTLLRRRALGPHVTSLEVAVGDSQGSVTLHLSDALNVDHRTYPTGEARRQIQVGQVALDDVLGDTSVDFLKMDVQGYEPVALRGMAKLLRRSPNLRMILEFWPWGIRRAGGDPRALLEVLRAAGYEVHRVGGGSLDDVADRPTSYFNIATEPRQRPG